ncbi:hypothetical protein L208DRAFT_1230285 [Tricholoma matsutake]|nr:hypothetical protein L208DRAFT_1230285 [Tricholoma matsutake 945]
MYTGNKDSASAKHPQTKYCPVRKCESLELLLKKWVFEAHGSDPLCFGHRLSSILDDPSIKALTMACAGTLKTRTDLTQLLDQSLEWENTWAGSLLSVIAAYDAPGKLSAESAMDTDNSSDDEPLAKKL